MSKSRKKASRPSAVIDVVIVTGGRFDLLAKCMQALEQEAKDIPISVYLIDNNTDANEYKENSHLFFRSEDSSIISIQHHNLRQEVGYAEANNLGAKMGHAPLIMFLNDDVELQPGAIQEVIDTFNDGSVGVVGIKLLFPPDSTRPGYPAGKVQHIGLALNIRGDAEHPLIGWSPDNPKTCRSMDVLAVTGACLTIRRQLFNGVKGFGLEYGLGTWEDIDLCMKARQAGFRVYVNVKALGHHYTNATVEKKRRGFPIMQNRLIFQSKWQSSGLMAWTSWDMW